MGKARMALPRSACRRSCATSSASVLNPGPMDPTPSAGWRAWLMTRPRRSSAWRRRTSPQTPTLPTPTLTSTCGEACSPRPWTPRRRARQARRARSPRRERRQTGRRRRRRWAQAAGGSVPSPTPPWQPQRPRLQLRRRLASSPTPSASSSPTRPHSLAPGRAASSMRLLPRLRSWSRWRSSWGWTIRSHWCCTARRRRRWWRSGAAWPRSPSRTRASPPRSASAKRLRQRRAPPRRRPLRSAPAAGHSAAEA
mmetsp:Transcript_21683/g.68025  ORF Transcript_21683/g.68025 Transcript_21683/m.68025 type:complete len:253 (+) Transcript_21683:76-834(+)